MPILVREVTTLKDLKTFVRFPKSLYKGSPYWVPALTMDDMQTLRRDRNPAFEHCMAKYWLAYRDGKVVGRIAGIINQMHVERWGQRYARFGWIDFADDQEAVGALLKAVEDWARDQGMTAVHGPLGFTDLDREGMLVEGFNELGTFSTMYNHAYYPRHMEALGYQKDIDWLEYEIGVPEEPPEKVAKLREVLLRRCNLHMLEAKSKREILKYADQIFEVLEESYRHLYGVVPLSRKQVDSYVKQYFDYVSPEFVPVVLDENDRLIAFGLALPSLSRALQKARGELFPFGFIHILRALKKNDRADLYLVAIKPEFQGKGINALIIHQINLAFNQHGITLAESNPELETNQAVQAQWKNFKTRQHKRRRCYIKHLELAS